MRSTRDPDLLIKAFLDEGIDELPDRSFDAVRTAIDRNVNGPSSARVGSLR